MARSSCILSRLHQLRRQPGGPPARRSGGIGPRQNTVVVLWGDHGWHLGEKQITGKNTLWERSPRAFDLGRSRRHAGPGVRKAGRTTRHLSHAGRTCGLPRKDNLEGHSLVPQLQDAGADAAGRRSPRTTRGTIRSARRNGATFATPTVRRNCMICSTIPTNMRTWPTSRVIARRSTSFRVGCPAKTSARRRQRKPSADALRQDASLGRPADQARRSDPRVNKGMERLESN